MSMKEKCINNTIERIENPKHRFTAFTYIKYFCRKNDLSMEDEFYIREQISKYIDEHTNILFNQNFSITGI